MLTKIKSTYFFTWDILKNFIKLQKKLSNFLSYKFYVTTKKIYAFFEVGIALKELLYKLEF